ncbi:PepSY-associated TM helix domain-containing protein [Dasania marina]|uniref:PepSY-associated TM helix domain-containing protein n=1 Tax=Dasania marina TaxID=471499 RepID=UPI0030DBEB35
MRQTMFTLHKYSGLLLGMIIALIGLSGSLLVFDHALDEALTPELRGLGLDLDLDVATEPSATLQQVLSASKAAVPAGSQATRIYLARQPGSPHTVRFNGPPPAQARLEVNVAADSAQVLTVREWGYYPMSWLYRLHYTLLSGHRGETVVGILGFVLLFYCISGLVLWWPRRRGHWRLALRINRQASNARFLWDLHRVVGVASMPVLSLCAITGIAMVFAKPTAAIINSVAPLVTKPSYSVEPSGQPLPLDTLIAKAKIAVPHSEIKRIFLPQQPQHSLRLSANFAGEPWSNHGASNIWLNPYNGEVLGLWDARQQPWGNTVLSWVFPLHNADVLGLPGRWLWLIVGTIPALLFFTGTYLWWRKWRRRR